MNQTLSYYDTHAETFIQDTVSAQMHTQQDAFLAYLPAHAHVLDLGAGSGRDSLYFMQHGCSVTMVDGSAAMCKACEKLTGQKAVHSTFLEYETDENYDGVWACASLLHLRREEIPLVLSRLAAMLRQPNIVYLSFKYGEFAGERNGRYFTDLTEESLAGVIREANAVLRGANTVSREGNSALRETSTAALVVVNGSYTIEKQFITEDVRPGRTTKWLNAYVRLMDLIRE